MPILGSFGNGSIRGFSSSGSSGSSVVELYNFFTSSAPSGISTFTSGVGSYSYAFNQTFGLQTAGDAGNGFVYTVQTTNSYVGDYLVQTSFLWGDASCPDPSLAVFPVANGRTAPAWNWGASSTRICAQFNCTHPIIYGTSNSTSGTAITPIQGSWYTIHFWYEPSLSRTRVATTLGQNDWSFSGSVVSPAMTGVDFYSPTAPVYFGLASDYDGGVLGNLSTNFSALRITKL